MAIAGGLLYKALKSGEDAWIGGERKEECLRRAKGVIENAIQGTEAKEKDVRIRLDYLEMNDAGTFEVVRDEVVDKAQREGGEKEAIILSGAIWVGTTRLIDNVLLGDVRKIFG